MPLKTKTGKEVAWAFRKLFLSGSPSRLLTALNSTTNSYGAVLAANNVTLYSTENEEKSSIVKRWNRMMKNIMWKYFTANNTQKYIDVLPSMVKKYNNTYHRSIKLTPSDACNPANHQHVHNVLYCKVNARKATSPKFHVGNKVPITAFDCVKHELLIAKMHAYNFEYNALVLIYSYFTYRKQRARIDSNFSS